MHTSEIDYILRNNPHTQRYYLSTFPSDLIPKLPKPNSCFISNTDPHTEKGQHWVAFYTDALLRSYYFDSYGLPPLVPNYIRFLHKAKEWDYNKKQLQRLYSTNCGEHCIRFLIETCRTRNPHHTMKQMQLLPLLYADRDASHYFVVSGAGLTPAYVHTDQKASSFQRPLHPHPQTTKKEQQRRRRRRKRKKKTSSSR